MYLQIYTYVIYIAETNTNIYTMSINNTGCSGTKRCLQHLLGGKQNSQNSKTIILTTFHSQRNELKKEIFKID